MNQCIKDLNTITTTSDGLAACLNLSRPRVIQLANDGVFIKDKNSKYNVQDSISKYIHHIKTGDKNLKLNSDNSQNIYWAEKAKNEIIKRVSSAEDLKLKQNKLHEAKDVERVMGHMLSVIRTKLLGLGSILTPALVGKSKDDISKVIDKSVEEMLMELKDYAPEMFSDETENN